MSLKSALRSFPMQEISPTPPEVDTCEGYMPGRRAARNGIWNPPSPGEYMGKDLVVFMAYGISRRQKD